MIANVTVHTEPHAQGHVAWVTIDNRGKLNSLSSQVMADLTAAFQDLARDADLRAVVLTGAGEKAFIGGAFIDEMAALAGPAAARGFILKVHGVCQAIRDLPCPVIAAINGWCLGAGLEVAAACDMRLAADTAQFGMPEVKLGLPSVVEAALLPALIGWGRTRRILMTGETFDADEALSWGFVEEIHPQAVLRAAVDRLVEMLLEAEPRAVRIQKALIQTWEDLPTTQAIAAGVDAFEDAWTTDEPAKALDRFLRLRRAAKSGL
jgi:1,4-dihydroxy-2-naphthoyl-CoA synthase